MTKSVSYAVSSRETNIIQRAFRLLPCFIHFILYLNRRVYRVFIISYISTMPLIIHVFYENFENLEIWKFFAMFYTLYHIFKQESIQSRGTIKGRGMIPYHMPYHPRPISSLGPKGPLDDIGFSEWYGIWYGFCHVLFSM
jgi:hypothetical protein